MGLFQRTYRQTDSEDLPNARTSLLHSPLRQTFRPISRPTLPSLSRSLLEASLSTAPHPQVPVSRGEDLADLADSVARLGPAPLLPLRALDSLTSLCLAASRETDNLRVLEVTHLHLASTRAAAVSATSPSRLARSLVRRLLELPLTLATRRSALRRRPPLLDRWGDMRSKKLSSRGACLLYPPTLCFALEDGYLP